MSTIHALMAQLALASDDTILSGPVETVPATDMEAAIAVADLQPEVGVTEQTLAVLDDMVETSEGLETDAEILEATIAPAEGSTQEGPGAEPVAAGLAVESIARARRRFGIAQFDGFSGGYKPAQESFSRASARKPATKLLLLGIGDTLSKIWQKIKAFFKGLWERIKNGVTKIFQSNVKTAKRAEQLLLANNENNNPPKDQRIKSASIAKGFATDSSAPKFDDVQKVLKRHIDYMTEAKSGNESIRTYVDKFDPVLKELDGVISSLGKNNSVGTTLANANAPLSYITNLENQTKVFVDALFAKYGGPVGGQKITVSDLRDSGFNMDNIEISQSDINVAGPFFGRRYLYVARLKNRQVGGQTTDVYQLAAGMTEITKGGTPTDAETLTQGDCEKICRMVKDLCSAMNQYEYSVKVGNTVADDLMAKIDSSIKLADKLNNAEDQSNAVAKAQFKLVRNGLTYARVSVQGVIKILSTNNSSLPVYTLSAANTALDFVSASIKARP